MQLVDFAMVGLSFRLAMVSFVSLLTTFGDWGVLGVAYGGEQTKSGIAVSCKGGFCRTQIVIVATWETVIREKK